MAVVYTIDLEMNPDAGKENLYKFDDSYPMMLKNKFNQTEFREFIFNCNAIFDNHRERVLKTFYGCSLPKCLCIIVSMFTFCAPLFVTILQLNEEREECISECKTYLQNYTHDKHLQSRNMGITLKHQIAMTGMSEDSHSYLGYYLEFQIAPEENTMDTNMYNLGYSKSAIC